MKKALILLFSFILSFSSIFAQDINLTSEHFNSDLYAPSTIKVTANIEGINSGEPAFLKITNTESGYRKLKFGNNSSHIYSPKINTISGGNSQLEITLRDPNADINWSKMRLRPQAKGSLILASYLNEVGGLVNQWKTITIPLSDFDSTIDFSNIAYMEFPYSADAGPFELHISKVEVTGGDTPYLWFGDEKLDNIHDGTGATYRMLAQTIDAVLAENNIEKVEFYFDQILTLTDLSIPYEFTHAIQDTGWHTIYAKVYFDDATTNTSESHDIYINSIDPVDFSINILSPEPQSVYEQNTIFNMEAEVDGASLNEPTYLNVTNPQSGYRKLKMGYDELYIYGPSQNVLGEGNTHLEITLRVNDNFSNWSKIKIRPMALGSLILTEYIENIGGISDEWTTISIPLEDFDSSIDFSSIKFFEFPYSADAGIFNMDIQKMEFVGSNTPFLWFGETKTNNKHNGDGHGGELTAALKESSISEETVEKVNFFIDNILIGSDYYPPYKMDFSTSEIGNYTYTTSAKLFNQEEAFSSEQTIIITEISQAISPVEINILSPNSNDSALLNEVVNITIAYNGFEEETETYLKVWNAETGYRKLKLGYDEQYIYAGHANAVGSGNDTLEITLKAFSSQIPWDKIRIRPSAKGSLSLDPYLSNYPQEWTTIKIPLSHFDETIDFSDLSFIEFPYSANAGAFSIGIKSMRFIGSNAPFIWFNETKNNNAHDGTGGSGKLFAEVFTPNPNAITIIETSLIIDSTIVETLEMMSNSFNYTFHDIGMHSIQIQTLDSDSLYKTSEALEFNIYEDDFSNLSEIIVEFDSPPTALNIQKSTLKYNKDFAYSLTIDDGKIDGYTYAFQLLNGGYIQDVDNTYPGLSYTDGCGNDVLFTAGLAWNSVSSSFSDIHINTPDYITWTQLNEMHDAGWDIFNHAYSHAAYGETEYQFQVEENNSYVLQKTGIRMNHFVIPSGDLNYIPYAFGNNMRAVYSNKSQFSGYPSGIDIDAPYDTYQQKIYRRFLNDDLYQQDNITETINQIAQISNENNHIWFSEFTHRVHTTTTGGSLIFSTFEYYMNYIAEKYGKIGTDKIWVASLEEVHDYLLIREKTTLNYTVEGNRAHIYLNLDNIPADMSVYNLSLNINSDSQIISVTPQFDSEINFNSETGLVNLTWSQNTLKSMATTGLTANNNNEYANDILVFPNPVKDGLLNIIVEDAKKGDYEIIIRTVSGSIAYMHTTIFQEGHNEIKVQFSDQELQRGQYFLTILGKGKQYKTQELIVL